MARTEALQLRGEREAALGRLHAALEASHTLRRESDRQLLEVRDLTLTLTVTVTVTVTVTLTLTLTRMGRMPPSLSLIAALKGS